MTQTLEFNNNREAFGLGDLHPARIYKVSFLGRCNSAFSRVLISLLVTLETNIILRKAYLSALI